MFLFFWVIYTNVLNDVSGCFLSSASVHKRSLLLKVQKAWEKWLKYPPVKVYIICLLGIVRTFSFGDADHCQRCRRQISIPNSSIQDLVDQRDILGYSVVLNKNGHTPSYIRTKGKPLSNLGHRIVMTKLLSQVRFHVHIPTLDAFKICKMITVQFAKSD